MEERAARIERERVELAQFVKESSDVVLREQSGPVDASKVLVLGSTLDTGGSPLARVCVARSAAAVRQSRTRPR